MSTDSNRRGKVTFVIPFPAYGGAERLLSLICASLREDGVRVELRIDTRRSLTDSSLAAWFEDVIDGWRVIDPEDSASTLAAIAEPDTTVIVYCGFSQALGLAPTVSASRRSLRQVAFLFNSTEGGDQLRAIATCLDLVIAESLDALSNIGEMRLDGPAARLIPSRPAVAPAARAIRDDNRLLVGFIGRMDPIKNPLAVLRIAALLPKADFAFVLAGGGELQRRVRWETMRLSLRRNVKWRGHIDHDALARQFAALDVLLTPSLIDGRPLVVQEAQQRGVTVVASCVGGIPELVEHGVTGLLCEPGADAEFAQALLRLHRDPALRKALADEARLRAMAQEPLSSRLLRYKEAITGTPATEAAWQPTP